MTQEYRQVPHPSFRVLSGIMMDISGWCSECGVYLERQPNHGPILNPDGHDTHRHSQPWKLGPKP